MGRKGLGKLAGFGVARVVSVVTRRDGQNHATRITLKYDDIIRVTDTNEIPIVEERLDDGGGITPKGTRIILSELTYGPTGARETTISNRVADHFAMIDPGDFSITINGTSIEPTQRTYAYAWPEPSTVLIDELVSASYRTEDGRDFSYQYRMRFVEDRSALDAKDRGVRIYVNRRLAAAPSLLKADTNMHGFRMTDYLDGVVHADFIDEQPEDYIATNRQSLKWESPLLSQLYLDLSEAIRKACYDRQIVRDEEKEREVREDQFTKERIEQAGLSNREKTAAVRIGRALASLHKQGTADQAYKSQFGEVISAMGRGEILAHLAQMASDPHPELKDVIDEVMRLTAEQRDGFYSYVKGRMDAIRALRNIVENQDFNKSNNEDELHKLFKDSSWLIDPTFFQLVTSNRTERTMYRELERALQIGEHVKQGYDPTIADESEPGGKNERPDLVFLLGDAPGSLIVIVELKAPNTPLWGEHYRQLQRYIRNTHKWLDRQSRSATVSGILIGTFGPLQSKADEVEWLESEIERTRNQGEVRVFSISRVLENAELAHHDMIKLWDGDEATIARAKVITSTKEAAPASSAERKPLSGGNANGKNSKR